MLSLMDVICERCEIKKPTYFFKSIQGVLNPICSKCLNIKKKYINYYDYSEIKRFKKK